MTLQPDKGALTIIAMTATSSNDIDGCMHRAGRGNILIGQQASGKRGLTEDRKESAETNR
jgi:hypothetical protein